MGRERLKSMAVTSKRRVEVTATGRIRGDIHTPVLVTSAGAVLDGRIEMASDRPDETTVAARPSAQEQRTRQERD